MSNQSWEIYTGVVAPGGTTIPNSKNAHRAAMNMHAGISRPSYLEAGGIWFKTSDGKWYKYNGTADEELAGEYQMPSGVIRPTEVTANNMWYQSTDKILYFYDGTNDIVVARYGSKSLPLNDTTPSVKGGGVFEEVNTLATTITAFDDGVKADKLTILVTTSNMTLGPLLSKTGMTIPLINGDRLEFVHNGTKFVQTAGNVGMGVFTRLENANPIADWISSSTTSWSPVDVSDDGVRKGATKVEMLLQAQSSTTLPSLRATRYGGATTTGRWQFGGINAILIINSHLNDSGVFRAYWAANWSGSQIANSCDVVGYWI